MKKLLSLSVCFFICIAGFSQDPYHKLYTIEDGLPSNELYEVYFDEDNSMWITTDRGICNFNSNEFTTYSTKEGLAFPTNFNISPDTEGRLWFNGFDGTMTVLDDGNFRPYEYNHILQDALEGVDFYATIAFDKEGTLYTRTHLQKFLDEKGNQLLRIDSNGNARYSEFRFDTLATDGKGRVLERIRLEKKDLFRYGLSKIFLNYVVEIGDEFLFSFNRKSNDRKVKNFTEVFYTKKGKLIKLFETNNKVTNLFVDSENRIIISTIKGILVFDGIDNFSSRISHFQDEFVSGVNQDKEGNYWMTTRAGLFFIPSLSFQEYTSSNVPVKAFGSLNSELLYISGRYQIMGMKKKSHEIHEYVNDKDLELSVLNSVGKQVSTVDAKHSLQVTNESITTYNKKYIRTEADRNVWFKDGKEVKLKGLTYALSKIDKSIFGNTYQVVCDTSHSDCYVGYMRGVAKLDLKSNKLIYDIGELVPEVNRRVAGLEVDSKKNLWVSTMGNGISCIENDSTLLANFTVDDGLVSDLVNNIYLENDSTIWICTNKGLNRIEIELDNYSISTIDLITSSDGLKSNFVYDFVKWDGRYWVGTNYGMTSFDTTFSAGVTAKPVVVLNDARIIGQEKKLETGVRLKEYENDLIFDYTAVTYRKPKDKVYSYRLSRNNSINEWSFTNNRSLTFNNLDHGKYVFEVKARNKYNTYSDVLQFEYEIMRHFSETWWFILLCFLLLVGVFFAIYKLRMNILKQRYEKENKLTEALLKKDIAELSTFRNQFNPHFVFNFLNSIQSNVFSGDIRTANFFLTKFSKLIREGLNLMNSDLIKVEREINYITDYLDLEIRRFPDKFTYTVHNEQNIPLDLFLIPPLILQPVFENILKHAFDVDSNGQVIITIKESSADNIEIVIKDNGKGMAEVDINEIQNRDSFGLKITYDRIDLLNLQYSSTKSSFRIFPNSKEERGTTALFILPKIEADE